MNYHKNIKFEHKKLLKIFLCVINANFKGKNIHWTKHAKQRLIERITDLEHCFNFFHNVEFNYNDIIEYTYLDGDIEKALFRVNYDKENDIALVINKHSQIITIYFNNKMDEHFTLNKTNYATA